MRTLIDLPDSQIEELAVICERMRQPRAAIIRMAIAEYLQRHNATQSDAAFGLWGSAAMDGLDYQQQVRSEW